MQRTVTTIDRSTMDKELFLKKYEEVYRDMYRYAFLTLGHKQDAEDAVSEAVCDAYRQRDSLRDPEAFRGWIFTILCRKCTGKKKEYATKRTDSLDAPRGTDDETPILESLPDENSPDAEDTILVKQMLFRLSDEDRQIIILHILGGYSSAEIGDIMGMKDATVRSREHRALKQLRKEFGRR